jgi:Protein of unknown function (DUF3108)
MGKACRLMLSGRIKFHFDVKYISLIAVLFALFFAADGPLSARAQTIPEKLVFDLTWAGIKAGTATQEIINDNGVIKIVSTARSADWISVFFKVDDRIESVLAGTRPTGLGLPKIYRMKIREGKTRRDKEITFDRGKRLAFYVDHLNGEKKDFEINENTLDTLSSFYFVRSMPLEVGKSVFIDVFDSKRLWNTEVQVLRREKIETVLGTFNTIVVRPLMKSEGIFEKKGDMYIWLTDDKRHVPVKMKTKVPIGSITATLVGGTF